MKQMFYEKQDVTKVPPCGVFRIKKESLSVCPSIISTTILNDEK